MLDNNKEEFVTEAGDIEEWRGSGVNNVKLIEDLKEHIHKLKSIVD